MRATGVNWGVGLLYGAFCEGFGGLGHKSFVGPRWAGALNGLSSSCVSRAARLPSHHPSTLIKLQNTEQKKRKRKLKKKERKKEGKKSN